MHPIHFFAPTLVVAAALFGVGCSKERESANAIPAATTGPLAIEEIRIEPVAENAQAARRPFLPNDRIVITVKTNGATKGGMLETRLIDLNTGQHVGSEIQTVADAHRQPIRMVFVFGSQSPRSPGRYLAEFKLDGKLAEQRDFDVVPSAE